MLYALGIMDGFLHLEAFRLLLYARSVMEMSVGMNLPLYYIHRHRLPRVVDPTTLANPGTDMTEGQFLMFGNLVPVAGPADKKFVPFINNCCPGQLCNSIV